MIKDQTILVPEEPRGPSQLIELPVPAQTVSIVAFPAIQNLQNQSDQVIIIKALRLIPNTVLTTGPINGFSNAVLSEIQKCSLVLYSEGWLKGQLIPLASLIDIYTEGSGIPWRNKTARFDNWRNVDWTKSYIQYSNGTTSSGAAYEFIFEVEYQKFRIQRNGSEDILIEITGAS